MQHTFAVRDATFIDEIQFIRLRKKRRCHLTRYFFSGTTFNYKLVSGNGKNNLDILSLLRDDSFSAFSLEQRVTEVKKMNSDLCKTA